MNIRTATLPGLFALSVLSGSAAASSGSDAAGAALVARFSTAWAHSDAAGLATLFAPGADLVTPDGIIARGPEQIARFYAATFAHGYRGSQGTGTIAQTRVLSHNLALVDGTWSITGAHRADGSARPPEHGTLTAVLGLGPDGWRVLALRESASAGEIVDLTDRR